MMAALIAWFVLDVLLWFRTWWYLEYTRKKHNGLVDRVARLDDAVDDITLAVLKKKRARSEINGHAGGGAT